MKREPGKISMREREREGGRAHIGSLEEAREWSEGSVSFVVGAALAWIREGSQEKKIKMGTYLSSVVFFLVV